MVARRAVGSSTWATFNSGFAVSSSEAADDHNVIAMAVDSAGYMHLSWNMHNLSLNYATSNAPVTSASLPSLTFIQRSTTNAPTLFPDSGTPATSVADVVQAIPRNSSFINQTSMTVDCSDNPLIATYYAPGWNTATNSGNPNRQYMLVYYDGTQWRTSQITNRTSDTAIDTSGSAVRDLGRPVVLVDPQGRILVITRSEDTAMGSYSNPSTPDNEIVVFYNTVSSLRSSSPAPWRSVPLDTANMGS